jgi:hypothetical protein
MTQSTLAIRDIFRIKGRGTVIISELPTPRGYNASLDDFATLIQPGGAQQGFSAHYETQHFGIVAGSRFNAVVLLPSASMADAPNGGQLAVTDKALSWIGQAINA